MNYLVDIEKVSIFLKDVSYKVIDIKELLLFDQDKNLIRLKKVVIENELTTNYETFKINMDGSKEYIDYIVFTDCENLNPTSSTAILNEYEDYRLYLYENGLIILEVNEGVVLGESDFIIKEVDSSYIFRNSLDKFKFSEEDEK